MRAEDDAPGAPPGAYHAWPPPGLEPIHGVAWPLIRSFALGALIFALPLLIAIATDHAFWSLGPFGESFWIPLVTALIALAILFEAAVRLSRAIRGASRGAALGYDLTTMLTVATDGARDAGFIAQGARSFAALSPDERHQLLLVRRASALGYLTAALWIPVGLGIAVLLAFVGWAGNVAVWMITLAPAALLTFAAWLARILEDALLAKVKKRTAGEKETLQRELAADAEQWRERRADSSDFEHADVRPANQRALRRLAVLVVLPAIVMTIPVLAIVGATVMGPLLAAIAVPSLGSTEQKIEATKLFAPYLLPPDSSITPQRAGQALLNLSQAGGGSIPEHQQRAVIALPKLPAERSFSPLYGNPNAFVDTMYALWRTNRFTEEQRRIIREAANHPAFDELAIIARAPGIDITSTRWIQPLPDSLMPMQLSIPRFGNVREVAYLNDLRMMQMLLDGKPAEAEIAAKEVITVGQRITDDGVTLIDALIGTVIVTIGARSLEPFYRATGRTTDAVTVAERIKARDLIADAPRRSSSNVSTRVSDLVDVVRAGPTNRAVRWEAFSTFNLFAPCINLRAAVFRNDAAKQDWFNRARERLVVYPADSALFEFYRRGLYGARKPGCGMPLRFLREIDQIGF